MKILSVKQLFIGCELFNAERLAYSEINMVNKTDMLFTNFSCERFE